MEENKPDSTEMGDAAETTKTVNIGLGDVADAEPFGYGDGYRDAINDQLRARIALEYARGIDWPVVIVAIVLAVLAFRLIYSE